eukprot:TRINITY_DN5400_c0_g1_i2.p1 TRINITY_DN5400_c0_g1~~TRINITY_DN5400_c0_g1_i2.p1  ORF type:complete len:1082 (+),score=192.30 TRINITY_DN5400_c0_g1_i2:64-3309(+)
MSPFDGLGRLTPQPHSARSPTPCGSTPTRLAGTVLPTPRDESRLSYFSSGRNSPEVPSRSPEPIWYSASHGIRLPIRDIVQTPPPGVSSPLPWNAAVRYPLKAPEIPKAQSLERGTKLVDRVSGLVCSVLGVTKTHCKVRYEQETTWRRTASEGTTGSPSEEFPCRIEILPFERFNIWNSPQQEYHEHEDVDGDEDAIPVLECTSMHQVLHNFPNPPPPPKDPALWKVFLKQTETDSDDSESESSDAHKMIATPSYKLRHLRGQRFKGLAPALNCEQSKELSNFKKAARAAFGGSLVAAWRLSLDVRGNGAITFQNLVRGGRNFGFVGNYHKIWNELTCNDHSLSRSSGRKVTLAHLDPKAAEALSLFRQHVDKLDLTLEDFWEDTLDAAKTGRCASHKFLEGAANIGVPKKLAKEILKMIDLGQEGDVKFEELEIIGLRRRPVQAEKKLSHREAAILKDKEEKKRVKADFMGFLIRNYGNLVRAWRLGLDADGDGKLNFTEFCNACKRIGFRDKLRTLWRALDPHGNGNVGLQELDKEAVYELEKFCRHLEENYLTLDDVWERVLDSDKSGRCTEKEFLAACETLQWTGNAVRLFKWLDFGAAGKLTLEDCDFIGMKRRVEASMDAKQRIAERQARDRAEAEAMLGKFKFFLTQRYGNLLRAWRKELDPDGDGRLQFTEFCASCRAMNFQGNLKALWMSLDKKDTGFVQLEQLDPEAIRSLEDFQRLLKVFFTDLDTLWHSLLDDTATGRCYQEDFVKACKVLKYARQPQQLHKYLDIQNAGYITIQSLEALIDLPRATSKEDALRKAKETPGQARHTLNSILKTKFGSAPSHGWRHGFCKCASADHWSEFLDVEEFCSRCTELGFKGSLWQLWRDIQITGTENGLIKDTQEAQLKKPIARKTIAARLSRGGTRQLDNFLKQKSATQPPVEEDGKGDGGDSQIALLGRISLAHFLPEVHTELVNFKRAVLSKFDGAADLWSAMLQDWLKKDTPDAKLRKVEFVQAVRRVLRFTGDAELIFEACDLHREHHIRAQDLDFIQLDPTIMTPFYHFEANAADASGSSNVNSRNAAFKKARTLAF